MTIKKIRREADSPVESVIENTLYADRVAGVMFGPAVSKIILTMENFNGVVTSNTAIVLPTATLLEIVEQVNEGLGTNAEMREGLISGLTDLIKIIQSKGE